jgi:hypothetical protein
MNVVNGMRMIKPFKFFQKNITRSWLSSMHLGQLQWMYRPVGVIFYMERRLDGNVYTEELKTMTVVIYNRYINSYNQFMEMNRNNIIFVYEFVDNMDISNMITYNQDNFDDMPKDRPLIFRGVIRNNETI